LNQIALDCRLFPDIYFQQSQGNIATRLRCGGIFINSFITCLLLSQMVKFFFENRLTLGKVMGKSRVSCFFDSRGK